MLRVRLLRLIAGWLAVCAPAFAVEDPTPHGQDVKPGPALSPAEAVRKMTVPRGFTVEVVAAEPDIVNPVAMTFDERGRIWITESLEYPRREPGPGRDRVKVLEDTDHDGKADKISIFAEGLNIPSGIAVGHGGVWVANAPDILFLSDRDGDGKADTRETVVSGFGRFDTHELPNSLTWGPDGKLYGWNGVFNNSHIEYRGKTYDFTCALFRIDPHTRDFDIFAEGTSNPWGVAFDPEGSAFASACVIDHLWRLAESGHYIRQGGPDKPYAWPIGSIVDHKHQKAAYCGIHYFDSPAYPLEYRDKLYMGNIHGNSINADSLLRNGSTYKARGETDFLKANDAWFMPVAQKTGPDGCLYILDWYDRYHCYQDAGRDPAGIDRLKGRLYRVRYEGAPRAGGFNLAQETSAQLIDRLGDPNIYFRDQAQRILSERTTDRAAGARLREAALNTALPRKARMHAVWAIAGRGDADPGFLMQLLASPDPGFRAWGVRIAGNLKANEPALTRAIADLARDPEPDVRLQVATAAAKLADFPRIRAWLEILELSPQDPLIPHIVWQNLHPMLPGASGELLDSLNTVKIAESDAFDQLLPKVAERLLAEGKKDPDAYAELLRRTIATGDRAPEAGLDCIWALINAIRSRQLSARDGDQFRKRTAPLIDRALDDNRDEPLDKGALLLLAAWGDPRGLKAAAATFEDRNRNDDDRLDALGVLTIAKAPSALDSCAKILGERESGSTRFRGLTLSALGELDDPRVAAIVISAFPQLEPEVAPRAIELLTQRPSWAGALLDAIAGKAIAASALNVNQIKRLLALKDDRIAKRVRDTWGVVREERDPNSESRVARMRTLIRSGMGDPKQGAAAFKKVCAQCHALHGEGQEVGPDLTGNGRGSFEQLLSNVFDPSLVIGSAYQAVTVAATDGRVLTGLLAEDSPARVVLKTQGGKRETIPRGEIEEMKTSKLSLMPEDLEKQLSSQEIIDLFAYLCLDKPPSDPTAKSLPGSGPIKLGRE